MSSSTSDSENQSPPTTGLLSPKTVEEKADAVNAFLNTARLTGSRATFMAGFTYYSIGRYLFTCCENKSYVMFNMIALVLSIMTAGFSAIYVYYAQRIVDPELTYEFCVQALQYNRLVFRTSLLANVFYTIGVGLIPWAYYQMSDLRWIPLCSMIICVLIWYPSLGKIVRTYLSLHVPDTSGKTLDHIEVEENSPFGHSNRSEPLNVFLLKQSNSIAGRAIFISNLAQQGLMRFMPAPEVYPLDKHLANVYLVFMSLAMLFSFTSGNIFLLIQVFLPDAEKAKQLAFSILIFPFADKIFRFYVLGFVLLFLGNIFMADGNNFEQYRGINIVFGGTGLIMVLICLFVSKINYDTNIRNPSISKSNENHTSHLSKIAEIKVKNTSPEIYLKSLIAAFQTAGSMSTFASGYLWYNIITYDTDVVRLSSNDGNENLVRLNLVANMVTVTVALYSSAADTILSLNVNKCNSIQDKLEYLDSRTWIVRSIIWCYYLSLVGWFVCFGLFGFVKFNRRSWVPMYYALVGIAVMVAGSLYLSFIRRSAEKISSKDLLAETAGGSSEQDGHHSSISTNLSVVKNADEIAVSISRPGNMSSLGFSVIFLGGFAYFAVNFFNFNSRIHEDLYLNSMSLCFMTSMWVMVFADRYNYQINKCPTEASKYLFSKKTYVFYCVTIVLAYVVVVSLLIGFTVLGNVKSISNFNDIDDIIAFSVTVVVVFATPMVLWILKTFKEATLGTSFTVTSTSANIGRFRSQIQAGLTTSGFIAGNVCYEILFSDANSSYHFINQYYFLMMGFAFSFGVTSIIVSTLILLCLGELTSFEKKAFFVATLRRAKLAIFVFSMGCLLCWQASIIALSNVKYTGDKGGDLQSFLPGLLGLLCLIFNYFAVKRISDGIQINGQTVTPPAIKESVTPFFASSTNSLTRQSEQDYSDL